MKSIWEKLQDKKFPVHEDCQCDWLGDWETINGEEILIPTLSELIMACGDKFLFLKSGGGKSANWNWTAQAFDFKNNYKLIGHGKTPEEAVAKLWLEINKKNAQKKV